MRYPASILVLILVGLAIVAGLLASRSTDATSSASAADTEIVVAEATAHADVMEGGGGSTMTEPAAEAEEAAVTPQEWVVVPGTGVAIWPKPQSK